MYGTEEYIKTLHNRKIRSLISKLRCDTLPIAVETGRYRNVPRDQRLCAYCDRQEVEDAVHVIFKCTLYNAEREHFLQSIDFISNEPQEMFYELMKNNTLMQKTGYFISKLLTKRAGTV